MQVRILAITAVITVLLFGAVDRSAASTLSVVQSHSAYNSSTSASSISIPLSTVSGHLLVAYVREGSSNTTTFTVTDSTGQTWTQAGTYTSFSTANRSALFYMANSKAVTSVTANLSASVAHTGIIVYEIAGAATSSPIDAGPVAKAVTSNAGNSITSSALTTTNSNDILLHAVDLNVDQGTGTNNTFVPSSPFGFPAGGATDIRSAIALEIVSNTQSNMVSSIGWGTSAYGASDMLVAFKAATTTAVSISISPTSAALQTGATQQFSTTVSGTTNTSVTWSVNGVQGGNSTTGTVSTSGLYTAPATAPSSSVTVTATSVADSTKSASANVTISTATTTTATKTTTSGTYALSVSTQSNRSGAYALNGATLSGNAYVFTSLASQLTNYDPSGISKVCYWLDNTAMSGTATHCESVMPYDFAGSANNTSTSLANPWNTTVLANGTHTLTQQVTKSAGGTETDTASFAINNAAATVVPLSFTTSSLPNANVNQTYSTTLTASGGTAPYSWSVVSGSMAPGLTLSTSGTISGTPTTAGQYTFSVQVKDSAATPQAATPQADTAAMALTVAAVASVPPSVVTTALPAATVKVAYSTALAGSGGTTPYTWTMTSGALPSGLSFSSSGTISGTPSVTGTFPFAVQLTDATGRTASANESLTVSSASSTGFQKFYSSSSFWNTPIPSNPVIDPNSSSMIQQSILNFLSQNVSFSNGGFGMPLAYASSSNKVYSVKCTMYSSNSCTVGGSGVSFPIPSGTQVATGSDHHLVVVYQAQDGSPYAGKELDMWEASYDSSNDTWSAATVTVNDLSGWGASCPLGQHCVGNVAAGFSGMGGEVRPEEIAQGHIDHALAIATPYNRTGTYFACPATHMDSIAGSSTALPEGAQIQLDPTFNVDAQSWPSWVKTIAHALQTYGAYNRDFAGVVVLYGVTNQNAGVPSWSSVGVPVDSYEDLNVIPWNRMRVINLAQCN